MKKLMIMAVAAVAAVAAHASAFDWKTGTGQNVYLMNTTDRAASMTAVLFDASLYSQTAIVEAFAGGTFNSLTSLASVTTETTGAIKNTATGNAFTWGSTGDTLEAVFAIVFDDSTIFVSSIASAEGEASATAHLSFTGLKTPSQAAAIQWESGMTASAGWYQTVPEPTSGLLLLLGMAGLALKRKQA